MPIPANLFRVVAAQVAVSAPRTGPGRMDTAAPAKIAP